MLTLPQYNQFGIIFGNAIPYNDYDLYENSWIDYLNNIVIPNIPNQCHRISLIAMESAPESVIHPGSNYIFSD